jgi:hypothetical protein
VFDAVEMLSEEGQKRLHHYGRIDGSQPVPGFWTEDEIVGAKREPEG